MLKVLKLGILFMLVLSLAVGCAAENQNSNEAGDNQAGKKKEKTITLGVTPWSSTIPPTKIVHLLLEDMGYTVKEIEADVGIVFTGLASGEIDVFMDAWLPDLHRNYMEKYKEDIDDTAISYPNAEIGWVAPTYVKDVNSMVDIKGKESMFGNKVYGIEEGASASETFRKMIEAYKLDLEYVPSSESGMLAQASSFMKKEKPVLFFGWRPHPMFAEWDLKVLDDPKQYFKTAEVHVLTNKDFKDEAPEAYEFLSNWSIDIGDIEEMIVEIDNGRDSEEAAQEWIDNNKDNVNKMMGEE